MEKKIILFYTPEGGYEGSILEGYLENEKQLVLQHLLEAALDTLQSDICKLKDNYAIAIENILCDALGLSQEGCSHDNR